MGEDRSVIAAKDGWQDMLVVPSLGVRTFADHERVDSNDPVRQLVLGSERSLDFVGTLCRREYIVKWRSAVDVAEISRVL